MSEANNPPAVLLVEDEVLIRMMLVEALQDAGFAVVEAQNADAAVAALTGGRTINAVITDVKMPGAMDGIGLARWMREHAAEIPIILVSGFPFEADLWPINPKIAIIVKKPYEPEEVVGWVKSLVEARPV